MKLYLEIESEDAFMLARCIERWAGAAASECERGRADRLWRDILRQWDVRARESAPPDRERAYGGERGPDRGPRAEQRGGEPEEQIPKPQTATPINPPAEKGGAPPEAAKAAAAERTAGARVRAALQADKQRRESNTRATAQRRERDGKPRGRTTPATREATPCGRTNTNARAAGPRVAKRSGARTPARKPSDVIKTSRLPERALRRR